MGANTIALYILLLFLSFFFFRYPIVSYPLSSPIPWFLSSPLVDRSFFDANLLLVVGVLSVISEMLDGLFHIITGMISAAAAGMFL